MKSLRNRLNSSINGTFIEGSKVVPTVDNIILSEENTGAYNDRLEEIKGLMAKGSYVERSLETGYPIKKPEGPKSFLQKSYGTLIRFLEEQ